MVAHAAIGVQIRSSAVVEVLRGVVRIDQPRRVAVIRRRRLFKHALGDQRLRLLASVAERTTQLIGHKPQHEPRTGVVTQFALVCGVDAPRSLVGAVLAVLTGRVQQPLRSAGIHERGVAAHGVPQIAVRTPLAVFVVQDLRLQTQRRQTLALRQREVAHQHRALGINRVGVSARQANALLAGNGRKALGLRPSSQRSART